MTTIVLLHAFPLDGRMWTPQIEALSARYDMIAPDLRGFGTAYEQLDRVVEISMDLTAVDVARLLDARGIQTAVVGGISRGGYIAMAFARKHPERLRGLMLFDTRATPADEKEQTYWRALIGRMEAEGIAPLPESMRGRLFGPTALHQRRELVAQVDGIILSQKADAVIAAARGMTSRPDARPGLREIRVPVLCVAGAEDGAFQDTRAIANTIPGARFVEVPEAGHLSNMERPDMVNRAIKEFVDGLAEPGPLV